MSYAKSDFNYPAMLRLQGKKCVIVGGGAVAARKLSSLGRAGAAITVVAPAFAAELLAEAKKYSCRLIAEPYDPAFLDEAFVVIAATDSSAVNRRITEDAPFLCNNITDPELSNFTVPAVAEQGNIMLTVSTGGVPAYTRMLKEYFSDRLSADFAEFNNFLLTIRKEVKTIPSTPKQRTIFWRSALTPEIITLLENGKAADAKEKILDAVNSFRTKSQNSTC